MNWFKRDHRNIFVLVLVKKKNKQKTKDNNRGAGIHHLFFYLVIPPFPAKKGNRTLSLSGTVRYHSGAVLWNSLPSSIRKAKSLADFRQMF